MNDNLSSLRDYALSLVGTHIDKRVAANIVPAVALMPELLAELKSDFTEVLRGLCRDGILAVTTDINKNPMFGFNTMPEE